MPYTVPAEAHQRVVSHYADLEQPDEKVQLMYIWVDGVLGRLRCKTDIGKEPLTPENCKWMCIDGSKTEKTTGPSSDVYLKPCAIFSDPFRRGKNKLVLCETFTYDKQPYVNMNRKACLDTMEKAKAFRPWFGFEQRYTLLSESGEPIRKIPPEPSEYYCSATKTSTIERDVAEAHIKACLYAGIRITGMNPGSLPSQWEFQIGPCEGVEGGDHLWVARFILHRVAQDFGIAVDLTTKSLEPYGHSVQTNFSTELMRQPGGMKHIEEAVKKLSDLHLTHWKEIKEKQEKLAKSEGEPTPKPTVVQPFTSGIGNRNCSIRIPQKVNEEGCGYFEDRRPSASRDPYLVTRLLVEATCL